MTAGEIRIAPVLGSLGHSATQLLILLHATVVLVFEDEFTKSIADLQWAVAAGVLLPRSRRATGAKSGENMLVAR